MRFSIAVCALVIVSVAVSAQSEGVKRNAFDDNSNSNNNNGGGPLSTPCLPATASSEQSQTLQVKAAFAALVRDGGIVASGRSPSSSAAAAMVLSSASCGLTPRSVAASFPIPSASTLEAATDPSPLHFEAYDSRIGDFHLPAALAFLHSPVVALYTQLRGAVALVVARDPAAFGYKQSSALLALINSHVARTAAMLRLVTRVSLASRTHGPLDLSDGVAEVIVAPLPSGVANCKDFVDAPIVQRTGAVAQCNAPGQISFRTMTSFVDSLIGFVQYVVQRVVDGTGGGSFGLSAPASSCVVDATVLGATIAPQCVFVRCTSFGACNEHMPTITIEQSVQFDVAVLVLLALSVVLGKLRPYAAESAVLRWALCSAFGVVVLFTMITMLVLQTMKDNRLAQFGVLAGIAVSGAFAAAQGIVVSTAVMILEAVFRNVYALVVVALLCVLSTYIAHYYFGSAMPTIVYWSMLAGQYALFSAAWWRNREFCFIVAWSLTVLFVVWQVVRYIVVTVFGLGSWLDADAPRETFPEHVATLRAYVRPLAVDAVGVGLGHEAKMNEFERRGADYTKRQLAALSQTIRADPQKYTTRLSNPNEVMHWAGVGM